MGAGRPARAHPRGGDHPHALAVEERRGTGCHCVRLHNVTCFQAVGVVPGRLFYVQGICCCEAPVTGMPTGLFAPRVSWQPSGIRARRRALSAFLLVARMRRMGWVCGGHVARMQRFGCVGVAYFAPAGLSDRVVWALAPAGSISMTAPRGRFARGRRGGDGRDADGADG